MFDFKILIFKFNSTFISKISIKKIISACMDKTPSKIYIQKNN